MNEQSEGTQGLRPLTPEDVPVGDRWACLTCHEPTRPDTQPTERLLGGWVRVHCAVCGAMRVARPIPTQEQP